MMIAGAQPKIALELQLIVASVRRMETGPLADIQYRFSWIIRNFHITLYVLEERAVTAKF
ncbi:MAG: hypothetical protein BGP16_03305 [Sphingobium sp. 66-54]|nr:MAG: hypothetical protein BGP16_03305 [Sphingobium sp. 66-54]